jgi:hypothetical protein
VGDMTLTKKGYETRKSGRDISYGNQVCLTPKQGTRGGKDRLRPQGYKYNLIGAPNGDPSTQNSKKT